MYNQQITAITKELKMKHPKLDDFAANEVAYLIAHMDRLDISLEELVDCLLDAWEVTYGHKNA